jgi:hypothetical protein
MENTQKPQYISYVRYANKNDQTEPTQKKEDGGAIIAALMIGMSIIIVAVIFWQFTLLTGASVGAGYGVKKYVQYKNDPNKLVINRY